MSIYFAQVSLNRKGAKLILDSETSIQGRAVRLKLDRGGGRHVGFCWDHRPDFVFSDHVHGQK